MTEIQFINLYKAIELKRTAISIQRDNACEA